MNLADALKLSIRTGMGRKSRVAAVVSTAMAAPEPRTYLVWYERETGVSVYRSPNVDPDAFYCYFDPIDMLPESGRRRWADPAQHQAIVDEAIDNAKRRPS